MLLRAGLMTVLGVTPRTRRLILESQRLRGTSRTARPPQATASDQSFQSLRV